MLNINILVKILTFVFLLQTSGFCGVTFDATNDIITTTSNASLDDMNTSGTGITVSAWINSAGDGEGGFGSIVNKINGFTDSGMWTFQLEGSEELAFVKDKATSNMLRKSATGVVSHGTWTHVLMTWDAGTAATGIKFYVNGAETTYGTTTDGSGSLRSDASLTLNIGAFGDTSSTFNGVITEVAVFNRVLSANEITDLAKSKVKMLPLQFNSSTSLKGYWPIDECGDGVTCSTASMFKDYSGNANHGSPAGSPTGLAEAVLSYS